MKQFASHRTLAEIKAAARNAKVTVSHRLYDKGSDFFTIEGTFGDKRCRFVYSSFNGRFFGETFDGTKFSESSPLEGAAWFDAILDFVYKPQPVAVAA